MEYTAIYQVCIAISIVVLSLAVAVIAIVRAVTSSRKGNPSFMAGLKDLKKIESNKGSLNASVSGIEKAAKERKHPSYREALLVEQLMSRLSIAKSNFAESYRVLKELKAGSKVPQYKIEYAGDKLEDSRGVYLHAVASAAWWHFQGFISLELYKQFFLKNAIDVYDNDDHAQYYTNIEKAVIDYRHLVEHGNTSDKEEE